MISDVERATLTVGLKKVKKALAEHRAKKVIIAKDCDSFLLDSMEELCRASGISPVYAESMKELGEECGIEAALFRRPRGKCGKLASFRLRILVADKGTQREKQAGGKEQSAERRAENLFHNEAISSKTEISETEPVKKQNAGRHSAFQ